MNKKLCILTAVLLSVSAGCAGQETEETGYQDNGLPVIELTLDPEEFDRVNESPDHSYRAADASLCITVPDGYANEYSREISGTGSLELEYIRGRGHGTWLADKKPYRFKLQDKADLLGMGANKHWVLLANRYDGTLLRNRLISYMGSRMGMAYVPKSVPVELVVNGEYYGSYVLSEQVRIDRTRIGIDELKPEDISEPEITGGYLVCLFPAYEEAPENVFVSDRLVRFGFESPQFTEDEDGTPGQREYISSWLQKCEDAVFAGDPGSCMDLRSAADYWWIQEFSGNHDAFITSSTYLYKERSGKLFWGPLWDFDLSLGEGLDSVEGFTHRSMIWLDHMRAFNPEYQALLRERWAVLDGIIDEMTEDGGIIDQYAEEIARSYEDDQKRWMITDDSGEAIRRDLREETERLKDWMKQRQNWINTHIDDELYHVYNTVTFTVDGEPYRSTYVLADTFPDKLPQAPYRSGYIFSHWETEDGIPYEDQTISRDIILNAVYTGEAEAGITSAVCFVNPHDVRADIRNRVYDPAYELLPEGSLDRGIIWTSSDPDTATVDEYGIITMKKPGEVRIEARLYTGAADSFVLHICDSSSDDSGPLQELITEEEMILQQDEYRQIGVTPVPLLCNCDLLYTVDDESIAAVDAFGVVHALKSGTSTVTVTDVSSDVSASVRIVVE